MKKIIAKTLEMRGKDEEVFSKKVKKDIYYIADKKEFEFHIGLYNKKKDVWIEDVIITGFPENKIKEEILYLFSFIK